MLLGEFISPLGDKNRIAVPRTLRGELSNELVLTRGYEECILVVDTKRWSFLLDEINKRPLLELSVRDTKRFLLGGAFRITLDKQGRCVIPETLLNYAGITTEVVFVGVGEWMEIWDTAKWQEYMRNTSEKAGEIADRLS